MALQFGAGGNRLTASPTLSVPFSFGCWFNLTGSTDLQIMHIGSTSATTASVRMEVQMSQATKSVKVVSGSTTAAATSTGASSGVWGHALCVVNGVSDIRVYLNGAGKATGGPGSTITPTSVLIPYWSSNGGTVKVAECAVWSGALSDDDAASLAAGFSPSLVRPELLAFYTPGVRDVFDARGASITTTGSLTVIDHCRIRHPWRPRVFFSSPPANVTRSATNALLLTQYSALTELSLSASNAMAISQSTYPPERTATAENTLALAQIQQYNNNAQSDLALTQSAILPEVVRSVEQSIRFRQLVRARCGNIASGRYRR
ncbi:MAG: hypothetical protein E6R03_10405 [Hyphomicrobiaceae bacterium]|nr:MAG: hypothetical protein E6R03_10405 [Hyphomicrobiaceae bacterium]